MRETDERNPGVGKNPSSRFRAKAIGESLFRGGGGALLPGEDPR